MNNGVKMRISIEKSHTESMGEKIIHGFRAFSDHGNTSEIEWNRFSLSSFGRPLYNLPSLPREFEIENNELCADVNRLNSAEKHLN